MQACLFVREYFSMYMITIHHLIVLMPSSTTTNISTSSDSVPTQPVEPSENMDIDVTKVDDVIEAVQADDAVEADHEPVHAAEDVKSLSDTDSDNTRKATDHVLGLSGLILSDDHVRDVAGDNPHMAGKLMDMQSSINLAMGIDKNANGYRGLGDEDGETEEKSGEEEDKEEEEDEDEEDSDYIPDTSDDEEDEEEETLDEDEETEPPPPVDKRTFAFRCPVTWSEFTDMKTPYSTIQKAERHIKKDAATFLNVMKQTKQLQYKFVEEKARDNTGWVSKLYVSWLGHKYAIASHFHNTKKEARASVVKAFKCMAHAVIFNESFKRMDRLVAYYVYARVPDIVSMFAGDCDFNI